MKLAKFLCGKIAFNFFFFGKRQLSHSYTPYEVIIQYTPHIYVLLIMWLRASVANLSKDTDAKAFEFQAHAYVS